MVIVVDFRIRYVPSPPEQDKNNLSFTLVSSHVSVLHS